MPLFRTALLYRFQNHGWQENWWTEDVDASAATAFTDTEVGYLLEGRAFGTRLQAIKAYLHKDPRNGHTRIINNGVVPGNSTSNPPDTVSAAAFCNVGTMGPRSRRALIRCWQDEYIKHDLDGTPIKTSAANLALQNYSKAIRHAYAASKPSWGVAFMKPVNAPNQVAKRFPILEASFVSPNLTRMALTPADWTTLTTAADGGYATGTADVVFTGMHPKHWPGLSGRFRVVKHESPNIFIHYIPCFLSVDQTNPGYIRNAIMEFFPCRTIDFIDWRFRRTGRPTILPRGRGRKKYLRMH